VSVPVISCQSEKAARRVILVPPLVLVLVLVIVLVLLPLFGPAAIEIDGAPQSCSCSLSFSSFSLSLDQPRTNATELALEPIPELLAALVKIIKQQLHLPVSLRPGRVWMDFAIVSNLFRNGCFQV
jgi:hypothetical protein